MFTYFSIPRLINLKELRVKNELKHIENIKKLAELYPDLEECCDDNTSWLVSKSVNSIADRCVISQRNNLIELFPFIITEFGKVASTPPCLVIGIYEYIHENKYTPSKDLDLYLINNKMSEFIRESVHEYFKNPTWVKECIKA